MFKKLPEDVPVPADPLSGLASWTPSESHRLGASKKEDILWRSRTWSTKEVWRFLLGYHSFDSTYAEREYLCSISKEQAKRFTKIRERKGLIEKDVLNTFAFLLFPHLKNNIITDREFEFEQTMRLWEVLWTHYRSEHLHLDAEAFVYMCRENGEACIPPGTPPSLPVDDASMYYQQDDDDVL
ncbi:hypothetical protein HAX54_010737 [Datura stramonium]|uniref:Uncharacterized protein n=1 Tax=Datura stramonium TaxID=4076 RepID=A0ABS8TGT9_DATST|nr:hypothetical protein [Datura stramonium]